MPRITWKQRVKRCPFCDGYPAIKSNYKEFYYIECCFIRRFGYFRKVEDLIDAWNERSLEKLIGKIKNE